MSYRYTKWLETKRECVHFSQNCHVEHLILKKDFIYSGNAKKKNFVGTEVSIEIKIEIVYCKMIDDGK